MDRKEKLNRITFILFSFFLVMLDHGILLPNLPYFTERLVLDNFDTDLINFHYGLLTSIYPLFQHYSWWIWESYQTVLNGLLGFVIM